MEQTEDNEDIKKGNERNDDLDDTDDEGHECFGGCGEKIPWVRQYCCKYYCRNPKENEDDIKNN